MPGFGSRCWVPAAVLGVTAARGAAASLVETADRRGGTAFINPGRLRATGITVPPKCRTWLVLSPADALSTCINYAFLVADVRHCASTSKMLTAVYTFLVTILLSLRSSWTHFS